MNPDLGFPAQCRGPGDDPCIAARRRILYFSPTPGRNEAFLDALTRSDRCQISPTCLNPRVNWDETEFCWMAANSIAGVAERIGELYVSLLLVDIRCGEGQDLEPQVQQARALLEALDKVEDLELRYGFHRILVLVSGPDPDRMDQLIAELGGLGVGRILRQRGQGEAAEQAFVSRALAEGVRLVRDRQVGQRALCAAGGGITGIYYELGALKCLDDCFSGDAINNLDMYFGISAGAVVSGLLAAGYSVDEFMASVTGVEGGRIPPMSLALLKLTHLNHRDYALRVGQALKSTPRRLLRRVGRRGPALSAMQYHYGDLMAPPFHAAGFERTLQGLLSAPGATNDFTQLPRPLYVGASDQDARKHILFGAEGHQQVPISRAIQASLSVNPVFSPVPIDGRYYMDGAVTRTTNFAEAIRRGARLIFLLDPFVPYVSQEPGFASRRGVLYNIDQDLRTVSYTRFDNTRNWILRRHPEVSAYTFLPSNRYRRLMSINPMDHRPYMEIWRSAYLSTLQRVELLRHRMRGDLHVRGITLDLARAEAVADRLWATPDPSFEDFFPDGRVSIKTPPLCLQRRASARSSA